MFGIEFGEESPKGLFLAARIEIPDRVDQSAGSKMDDALFGTEPPELAVIGQLAAEGSHVAGQRLEGPAFNEPREVL